MENKCFNYRKPFLSAQKDNLNTRQDGVKNKSFLFELTFSINSNKQKLFFKSPGLVLRLFHAAYNNDLWYLIYTEFDE